MIEQLVDGDAGEVGELIFQHRPHAIDGRADADTSDRILEIGALITATRKGFRQTLGDFEGTAKDPTDILAVDEHLVLLGQRIVQRLSDRTGVAEAAHAAPPAKGHRPA